jgi:hypothetical protein
MGWEMGGIVLVLVLVLVLGTWFLVLGTSLICLKYGIQQGIIKKAE